MLPSFCSLLTFDGREDVKYLIVTPCDDLNVSFLLDDAFTLHFGFQ